MSTKAYAHDKKAEARASKEILRRLAELGGRMHDDDDITYEGDRLIIPVSMDLPRAIKFLTKKQAEMEAVTEFSRTFNYRPWDGAYCAWNALKRVFGVVGHIGSKGFFGPNPPQMMTINTDVGKQEQVPWGGFQLPLLPNVSFYFGTSRHPEYGVLFSVSAEGPKRYAAEVQGIFKIIEEELNTNSMYRGKAFDGQDMPEFIDLESVDREQVVYSEEVLTQLEVNVWAQLRYTDKFAERKIPLKRAVLVHGPYGTGKTLAALLTGQEAVANGWTFIKARPARDDLGTVLQTARLYQPAVVFYEDVDQITDTENVAESAISKLLDDFDGIEAKNSRILCVLTTNHVDRIHKGMARPGRLDAMIEINELDVNGVAKLVKNRLGDLVAAEVDWDAVFEAAEGYKPAFVTEFADRAIRYALNRNEGVDTGIMIVTDDLVHSARGLREQYDLMVGAKDRVVKPELDQAVKHTVISAVRDTIAEDYLQYQEG